MRAIETVRAARQAIWLDDISKGILDDGSLADYRDRCGVGGVTANPTIYAAALGGGDHYDQAISELTSRIDDPEEIFWTLAIDDVRRAADLFAPIYEQSGRRDGYVSLELAPSLAFDAAGTIAAATTLFRRLDRPNVLVKVPGTPAGAQAIETLIADGVNVNVTLLFGIAQWEAVSEAYFRGIECRVDSGAPVDHVASVASFFLSRIDTAVNDRIPDELRHRIAIASAAVVYAAWDRQRDDDRWSRLADAGAMPQQLLWASTSSKDPELPDTYYVERLVAPETIDTMPTATLDALCELDRLAGPRLDEVTTHDALEILDTAENHGVRHGDLATELQNVGVRKFADSFTELITIIDEVAARVSR